jgi:CspA family cold shock protein
LVVVSAVASGRIVQFNQSRGYGFIEPDSGGEDVFVHCNELGEYAVVARPGMRVEFNVLKSDRGLKASDVVVVDSSRSRPGAPVPRAAVPVSRTAAPVSPASPPMLSDEGILLDVLSNAEYEREITDVLISVLSSITASEIVEVRRRLSAAAAQRGWLED